ncbi:MAG: holo-ACP synthase [Kiritimatiellae bacterium]|nr:holo-ACP synthase [Kiritimatiellia bacterium]
MTPASDTVLGVGVDLVDLSRIRTAFVRWGEKFCDRVFLDTEREYCDAQASPHRHYAGRFAVKEAVAKAFGTGIGDPIGWHDIQIIRDTNTGAPSVKLLGRARELARRRGVTRILVSLSHTHGQAVAQAVVLGIPSAPARKRRRTNSPNRQRKSHD